MYLAFYNNPTAWIIIAVVVLLLFGGQKIPEMMRGLGQGMKEFKKGMHEPEDDELKQDKEARARVERVETDAEKEAQIRAEVRAEMEKEKQALK